MSQFYHKDCGGVVAAGIKIDVRILSFSLQDRTLVPGASETRVGSAGMMEGSTVPVEFYCTVCNKVFNKPVDFTELQTDCAVCGKKHLVSEVVSTAYTPFVGNACLALAVESLGLTKSIRKTPVLDILLTNSVII
jgi:hypothetical protein